MAAINFYIETGADWNIDVSGSGLGFFGSGGFGASVPVGSYQDNTYVTDGNGTVQGPHGNNVKWRHANSGEVAGSTVLDLQHIPNYESTLNVRFTHASAVRVQNAILRIYDRNNINVGASGVTTKVAEIIHPNPVQGAGGSGDSAWITPAGSGVTVPLAQSPGESGEYAGGGSVSVYQDDRHDWYVAISGSPNSIGSKTQYGLYVSLEYL
jgi:hypothetical protein